LAVPLLPEPESATAEQPLIETPPSLKFTVPVGLLPLTVPVNVTLVPTVEGVSDVATLVLVLVLPLLLTDCDSVALFEALLLPSPP
jgi:hypothetical protein